MTKKKLEEYKKKIGKLVSTLFEKELAHASIDNLFEVKNKLRFNNFAYSMRELSRHVLY